MEDSEDDVVEVSCDRTMEKKVHAKLLEIRKFVPFIQRVRKDFQKTLSKVQGQRLDALVGLLERENVSMNSLNKIEGIIEKLKTRFKPRIEVDTGEIIDISDNTEYDSTASTSSGSTTQPPDQGERSSPLSPSAHTKSAKRSNSSLNLASAATKAKPATPKKQELERRSKASCSIYTKTSSVVAKEIPVSPASSKASGSLNSPKTPSSKPSDEVQLTSPEPRSSRQAVAQDMTTPTIPEPTSAAAKKLHKHSTPSPGSRGVLAAMQKALMEEKKQRAGAQKATTNAAPQPEVNFSRRSYTTSPQLTRRSPAKPVNADSPDFARRSTSLVQPAPRQEASPRQSKKDVPVSSSVQDLPALVSASTPSPANMLEEARKKLAALRDGAGTATCMPPLSSNINDPRGRKGQNLPKPNINNDNDISLTLPPPARTPSPIPPPPSMRPGTWAPFSNAPLESGFAIQRAPRRNSVSPGDSRAFGDALAKDPGLEPRSFYGIDSREPRDPRIWKNKSAQREQQQQQQLTPQAQVPPYASDPRRATSIYSGYEETANRGQSNSNNNNYNHNVNANGNSCKSNWSDNQNGGGSNPRPFPNNQNGNEYAGGFNGSHSFRGGFRGGHNNRGFGNPGSRYERPKDVPRTYGEHRKAKARAEAEAKAKAAAELRQLEAEVMRQLEAEEKRRQLAAEKKQKSDESEAEKSKTPVTNLPELDTSYRNVTLGPLSKKLDFRIPKKTLPAAATITSTSSVNGNGDNLGCSSNSPASKSCDAKQDKDTYKNKDRHLDKTKDKDKVDKGKEKPENTLDKSEKHHKPQDKKANDKEKSKSDKQEKKRLNREHEKKSKVESSRELMDSNSVVSEDSSENTDNLENEPPLSETNSSPVPELAPGTPDSQQAQPVSEELDMLAKIRKTFGIGTKSSLTSSAKAAPKRRLDGGDEDTLEKPTKKNCGTWVAKPANEKSEDDTIEENKSTKKVNKECDETREEEEDTELDKTPKISKIKIVLGPNAHSLVVHSDDDIKSREQKFMDNKTFNDDHDDEEVPGPSLQFLHRIMKRRSSMAPTYSKPLVDKDKISSSSFTYEDLPQQKRGSQNARNLANMFKKTDDNCSLSTHNIITGKRRTRGCEASFNETQLSRSCFGLGQINRTRAKVSEGKATRAKTPAPAKDSMRADVNAVAPIPPPNRKRKRQTVHKESPDVQVEPKKARLEAEELKEVSDTPDERPAENSVEVSQMKEDVKSAEPLPVSEIETTPKPRAKPRRKRNELDKLNEDIAQMYYGEEVLRATGRRACTRRSRTPSLARSSSRHSRTSSLSQGDSISTVSDCSSIFVRNTARRGKAFRTSESGINRATFKATKDAKKPMLCRVRIQRCAALLEMLKDEEKEEQKKKDERKQTKPLKKAVEKGKSKKHTIANINPEWHSKSMAVIKCVVCSKLIRRSPLCHYMMCHKEHYAARLPPDVLTELRDGRGNRPDYWISQRGIHTLHFTCPFCQKPLLLCQLGLIDHLSAHMGESRFHCSRCNMPQNRLSRLQAHTATCGPGAKPVSSNNGRLPMSVHVCHICQFLQYSRENMDRHLMVQHGLTKEEMQGIGQEELLICNTTDVPAAESNEDGSVIVRGTLDNRPKPSTSKSIKKSKQQKKANMRFIKMVKKSVRLVKREREEQNEQKEAQEAQVQEQEDEGPAVKMEDDLEVPELPPPPPEREPVLVVNECLMNSEMDTDLEEVLEQSLQNTTPMVDEKPVVLLGGCTELAEPTVSNPEPADDPSAQEEDGDSADEHVDVETVVASPQPQPQPALTATSIVTSMVTEVSLAELAGDVLDGIGSDGSDVENDDDSEQEDTNNKNVDEANNRSSDDDGALTDEWVDLETAKINSKASKSIFHVFNRFCSRLNKGPRSSKAVPSNGSQCSDGSNDDVPDPSELMPTMQPLEPEPEPEPEDLSTSTGAKSLTKRVENVAFRKSSSDEDQHRLASYYCVQPGCPFLFSDELEGLENHFALEHPLVRWSGKCGMCHQKLNATGTILGISEELRHMRDVHMQDRSTLPSQPSAEEIPAVVELQPESQPESAPDPVPVLCKLRVRRFTGDRLVADSQAEKTQPEEIVSPDADNQQNGMLRDLLAAEPRPPNQQSDFHASGLGEFLSAKPDSTGPSAEPAEQQLVIVGYPSGLGLKISQVFSRTQISEDAVLSPVVNDPLPVEASAPAAVEENRNRFRCMANNCNFTAHKVMFVREHMKFHSFSFSSGHLNCAYCSHVAVDVDDYLRHGVIIHDLAPRSDLESSTGPPSVSQKIRDMLNLRDSASSGGVSTATTSGSDAAQSAINGNEPAAAGSTAGPTSLGSLSDVIVGLLKSTGYSDDKLFACPLKGCIVRLTGEQFVNHLRYHIRSTHLGSGLVRCKFCPRAMQPPALRTHLQQYHARHSIFCGICLATSVNKLIMLYHMRTVHCRAYNRTNRPIELVPLPVKPDAAKKSVETQCFVAVLEHPFGNLQMQNFQRKLFEEMNRRCSGTKTEFRSSEVHLLPSQPMFQEPLRCAECPFSSSVRTNMQVHLYEHKEENIREAYKREEALAVREATVQARAVVAPQRPVIDLEEPSSSGQPQPEPVVPGTHKPVKPPFNFVPSDLRYRCGFFLCGLLCSSESAMRKHMMANHKYSEVVSCPHCKKSQGHVCVEKYTDHLSMHKRYIFQCGSCSRHNSRRAIERHIQERHLNKNVDLIVHRHSDTNETTDVRWLKAPKLAREATMEYTCNLCLQCFPTTVQIMAHAASVHERNYQYHCPYCAFGGNFATVLIEHILREHPERDVQPVQIYQRIVCKSKQTLGFYCTICHKAATSYQKMAAHCEEKHMSRSQVQCPHCAFGHSLERQVALHIHETHPNETGLAVVQFERVLNEIPDSISWEMGRPIEIDPEKEKEQNNEQGVILPLNQRRNSGVRQLQEPQIVTEVVDLLDSDDETDEPSENDESKIMEFACTHCGGTNTNLPDLRTQHWARDHPDQPFYFRVQPLLLCCECKSFKGNPKALREHLLREHGILKIVAADIRQPSECAYCDYRYANWQDLAQHISRLGHLPNDLKHVTNAELDALMLLSASGSGGIINEYYQCGLCSVVMPTKATIGQHGQVEHSKPGERFCFRQLVSAVIYHCSYCIFTSTDELTTLRHMLDHYSRFLVCQFCTRSQPGGFDEYIQHCYTYHRNDLNSFREVHTFNDLKKFLMQVHYQFQNGLIITKSSLRYTRYNTDSIMRKLDNELMSKAHRPPIPRLHIRLKSTGVQLQSQEQEAQVQEPVSLVRIAKRRKTLNPGELLRQANGAQPQTPPTAVENAAPSTSSVAATFATAGSLITILKRRNSLVVRPATRNLDQH
ncbi:uncharacterized protein LOC120455206 [Drosophila santomea]|uniref:uncharacterized protein LOC120455206 n=1 Tax=Drosophila santomea TaxID=129105 RepID=UPI0019542438|nr:uncharacterized protein LOC120455206 [Drosophila santomea]XP_039497097.1 uncharacterized protein LOC120455206 [Drosophila santomea]